MSSSGRERFGHVAGPADHRTPRDGPARGARGGAYRPSRRPWPSRGSAAGTPSPTWCGPPPARWPPGPHSARWPATTWRPTPASGSGTTAASTPCGRRDGRVRTGPVGARVEPRVPPVPRRPAFGGRSHRRARRRGAVCPVPPPARSGVAAGLDGHSRPSGGLDPAAGDRRPLRRPVPARPGRGPSAGRHSAVVLGSSLAAGCTLDQTGPPAAQLSAWMTTAGGGRRHRAGGGGQPQHRPGHLPPQPARRHRTVCALLTNDAQTAIGNLPTPDTQLTDDLNAAYEDAAAAGNDCYDGRRRGPVPAPASASERAKLFPLLATAVDRVESPSPGTRPSTSTTAPTDAGGDPFGELNGRADRCRSDRSPPTATPTSTTGCAGGCCGRCPPGCSWWAAGREPSAT